MWYHVRAPLSDDGRIVKIVKSPTFLLVAVLALALAACGESAAPAPPDISTQAIFAQQTADAAQTRAHDAGNSANAMQVLAEQTRAAKTEIASDRLTADAQERFILSITQTAAADSTRGAELDKTEVAAANWTAIARNETYAAQTPTARAIATSTAVAESIATQTAVVVAIAAEAQQTRDAQNLKDEITAREEQNKIQEATLDARSKAAYVSEAIGVLWLPVSGALLLAIVLVSIWRVFGALVNRIHASSMSLIPAPQIITDRVGNVLGYLAPVHDGYVFEQIDSPVIDLPPELPPPALPLTSSVDTKRTDPAQPDPQIVNGLIHRAALESFVEEILRTGDWTQATWADKIIPLGAGSTDRVAYVLSKDTKDADGKTVFGGYARLLQLLVECNLIVGRRFGTSGKWNPHAPRTVGEVMAILLNSAPRPSLPAPEGELKAVPKRPRTRKPVASPAPSSAASEQSVA